MHCSGTVLIVSHVHVNTHARCAQYCSVAVLQVCKGVCVRMGWGGVCANFANLITRISVWYTHWCFQKWLFWSIDAAQAVRSHAPVIPIDLEVCVVLTHSNVRFDDSMIRVITHIYIPPYIHTQPPHVWPQTQGPALDIIMYIIRVYVRAYIGHIV